MNHESKRHARHRDGIARYLSVGLSRDIEIKPDMQTICSSMNHHLGPSPSRTPAFQKVQQGRDSESHSQAELRLSVGQLCASGPLPTSALPGRRSTAGSRTRNRSFKNHNVATVPDRNEFRIRNELKWIFRRFPKYSVIQLSRAVELNWIELNKQWIIIQCLFTILDRVNWIELNWINTEY